MKPNLFLLSALCGFTLIACGGGNNGSPGIPAVASGGATVNGVAIAQTTDKYTGTWKTACYLNVNGVRQASTNLDVYQTRSFTFTAMTASLANYVWIDTYYAPSDTACAQASIGKVTRPNTNTMTLDGTTTINGNSVDKVTLVAEKPFPGLSSTTTYVINGLDYANSFNEGFSDKGIAFVNSNTLIFGSENPVDASGYPTTLGVAPYLTYTKQ